MSENNYVETLLRDLDNVCDENRKLRKRLDKAEQIKTILYNDVVGLINIIKMQRAQSSVVNGQIEESSKNQ